MVRGKLVQRLMHTKRTRTGRPESLLGMVCVAVPLGTMGVAGVTARRPPPRRDTRLTEGATTRAPTLPGTSCPAFPADNVWNTPITGLPVNADSATWLASMGAGSTDPPSRLRTVGQPKKPYGIPWEIVPAGTTYVPIKFTYASESDPGPYPLSKTTPIEHGLGPPRHHGRPGPTAPSMRPGTPTTTPTASRRPGPAPSGTCESDALRPAGWTSADAAGLPILPGLVNYDEVASGAMDHAIRFTAQCTQQSYIWPARHEAGQDDTNCPPMGARFRLNADFTLPASSCARPCARPSSPP